jgi:hypothetical protein
MSKFWMSQLLMSTDSTYVLNFIEIFFNENKCKERGKRFVETFNTTSELKKKTRLVKLLQI